LDGSPDDFTPLLARIGSARVVMIGEASHGTHEFYRIRNQITKRLIAESGFTAVAVEADWPDAHRVSAFVQGVATEDRDASDALDDFRRFPQWMWRNADVLDFVGWLRQHNDAVPTKSRRVGFYGLDLYSLHASMAAVIDYLRAVDPDAAQRARERYSCFDHFGAEPQVYGQATTLGIAESCEREAVEQLLEMQRHAVVGLSGGGTTDPAAQFVAEQNARVVRNAERYYRAMFDRRSNTWNMRDQHMMDTLTQLDRFLGRESAPPRIVVWAHNSHIGDARATDRAGAGEHNIGQLARVAFGPQVALVGFSTYDGTVTAADEWGGPARRMNVRAALPESVEWLFHEAGHAACYIDASRSSALFDVLQPPRLARAIGVIYRPQTERDSHYYAVSIARQFDAVLHYDRSRAVEPLERVGAPVPDELPETYPSSL
jgi:erythromycin esterase-like protein